MCEGLAEHVVLSSELEVQARLVMPVCAQQAVQEGVLNAAMPSLLAAGWLPLLFAHLAGARLRKWAIVRAHQCPVLQKYLHACKQYLLAVVRALLC